MTAPKKPNKPEDGPSFEETLEKLEGIVHQLEEGQPGLDEALARYEEGIGLLRRAHGLLGKAQQRIELLGGLDEQGNPVTRPFDAEEDLSMDEKAQQRSRRRSASPPPSAEKSHPPNGGPLMDDEDSLF
ncbi:MAG: exodeoxyribonuclease VII small subunit [Pirellulales bacterium]|nr:exodeoxyribonuclease VII small subunit [Pirellulales bacterium]